MRFDRLEMQGSSRRSWRHAAFVTALLVASWGCAQNAGTEASPLGTSEAFVTVGARAQADAMGRGMNVLAMDPVWNNPAARQFEPRHFDIIQKAGFNTVRIAIEPFSHMDAANRLDPQWLATLDLMVGAALQRRLTVILDEHDFLFCGKNATACRTKLTAFWSQIAPRYRDAPNRLVFELLNEPNNAVTPELWNSMLRETLAIVRSTNPTRNVIIGPAKYNNLDALDDLELPEKDRHIIVTFHYYRPITFTHQGAAWVAITKNLSNIHWGSWADYLVLSRDFDRAKSWADDHDRPIFLGEFGVNETAPLDDRMKWNAAVVHAAESRRMPWAYWHFYPGFQAYDIKQDKWTEPLLHVLMPPK